MVFTKRVCPVKIPFKSTLNHQEHQTYMRYFVKFQIRDAITKVEKKEFEEYQVNLILN